MNIPYLALLRGVNVGGNNMIKMADLKAGLEADHFNNVRTYIQSGNVLFNSPETDTSMLSEKIKQSIAKHFQIQTEVVVFSKKDWQKIIANSPAQWGQDKTWKHNLLILLKPYDMDDVLTSIGKLKPHIEILIPGDGVLYQSVSLKMFGRATTGKLASNLAYKKMTVRNYNTATKLLPLL